MNLSNIVKILEGSPFEFFVQLLLFLLIATVGVIAILRLVLDKNYRKIVTKLPLELNRKLALPESHTRGLDEFHRRVEPYVLLPAYLYFLLLGFLISFTFCLALASAIVGEVDATKPEIFYALAVFVGILCCMRSCLRRASGSFHEIKNRWN